MLMRILSIAANATTNIHCCHTYRDNVFDGRRLKELLEGSDNVNVRTVDVCVAGVESRSYLVELAVRQN